MPRVLVVDGSPRVLYEVGKLLAESGYEVHSVHNANAGLTLLEKYEFKVVLIDYVHRVPQSLEGLTLIQSMKANKLLKHTPFIVWSTEDVKGISANIEQNGGRFLIKKPPYLDLPAVVSQMIAMTAKTTA